MRGSRIRQRDTLVGCLDSDAQHQDGWNRSKFGPIEKFLMYYENIEREKAELTPREGGRERERVHASTQAGILLEP